MKRDLLKLLLDDYHRQYDKEEKLLNAVVHSNQNIHTIQKQLDVCISKMAELKTKINLVLHNSLFLTKEEIEEAPTWGQDKTINEKNV